MRYVKALLMAAVVASACPMLFAQDAPPAATSRPTANWFNAPRGHAAEIAKMAMDKNPSDKAALTKALSDADPLARRYAIYGLQRLGDAASAKDLIPLLKDPDLFVHRDAAIALGKFRSREAIPALLEALSADDVRLRVEAFITLGQIGESSTQGPILKAMQDPRLWKELGIWEIHSVIGVANREFFKDTDRGMVPILKGLLNFKDIDNVELATLRTPEQKASSALEVSYVAADMLFNKYGDRSGEDQLVAAAASEDDYMQQNGAETLGKMKSVKAVPALIRLLPSEWMATRRRAIVALGQIGDAQAVAELEKYAKAAPPPKPLPAREAPPRAPTTGTSRPAFARPPAPDPNDGEPDVTIRLLAAAALEKIDGKKRAVDANDPPAVIPQIAEADLKTPGNKRPPQFICLGVDDCANVEGLESMLYICETLKDKGSKAVFTMWVTPHIGDWKNRDMTKIALLLQRLFDLGCEIANHTLDHNPEGRNWMSLPPDQHVLQIEGSVLWYRDNITGFTRPFTFKSGGGGTGTAIDRDFSTALLAKQKFLYSGGGRRPNLLDQAWPQGGQESYRLETGCLDAGAPPVHARVTDPIFSDYGGRFDYTIPAGVAMWKSNFEFHYAHPRRPILAVNAFHDWGLRYPDREGGKGSHRNEGHILKEFLLDVLVANKDKYPEAHCVTFRQVIEYVVTDGDLKHTLDAGNCQDSRNPVKPKID
jgi:HEAT repeat protein